LAPPGHAGKMILTVFAGIAEFERDLIRERTGAGRVIAKANGVRFGRPRSSIPSNARSLPYACCEKADPRAKWPRPSTCTG
jgi:DNA invertase Pin-like site-specific DNA recombinase